MELFRICSEKYANKLSASGKANRWNVENQYVIYASGTRSLATLELIAHRNAIMEGITYKMLTIVIPDSEKILELISIKGLPQDWSLLENKGLTQRYGSDWYTDKRTVFLKVPSAIIKEEFNYIINTVHQDFEKIKINDVEDFVWDKRLL